MIRHTNSTGRKFSGDLTVKAKYKTVWMSSIFAKYKINFSPVLQVYVHKLPLYNS